MSGNGAHLHFPIHLPNDPDSLALVAGVLRTLDSEFSDDQITVDTTVSNSARICRLYGTIARKGDSTADRPHRMARLVYVPDYIQRRLGDVCDVGALRAVAAISEPDRKPQVTVPAGVSGQYDRRLLVPDYLRDHGISYTLKTKGEFTDYILAECLFNADHKSPDAMITQGSRGGVAYRCLHDSCGKLPIGDVYDKIGKPRPEHYDSPTTSRAGNIGTVEADDGGHTVTVVFHDAWEAAFKPRPMRECIIEGLLRREEVGNVIASTKTGKSWFGLLLLICVATGRDWLGRRVARGNVLLIDNELHEETIENRIAAVRDKMNIRHETHRERFEYLACRGNWLSLIDLMERVSEQYEPGYLNLIVIDAKYRLFGNGLEENSNDDQTTFHNLIDKFAKQMNCPILLIHHSTKGSQTGKSVTDVGSGGGSQSRAVDLHLILRPHEQEGLAVLEAAVRSFAPVEPVSLQWQWPLWSVAHDVEPALKAERTRGDSRQEAKDLAGIDDLKKILSASKEPLSRNAMHKAFGGGKERLNRLIRVGLEKEAFEMVGTKEAQNGTVAELFTNATKEDTNVQRSESTV